MEIRSKMKRGTTIGWILVALSVVMSIWVIASRKANANQTIQDAFVVSDDGTQLVQYIGAGGSVVIPEGIQTIDAGVFANNASITSVVIPNTVTLMGGGVFQGCANLSDITIGAGLTSIPENTFRECQSIASVTIPGSVSSIGAQAFYGCSGLTGISIPASTTSISLDAFDECINLSSISVATGNGAYVSADGCLFNASGTKLLYVPKGKTSVSLPAGTTTIGSSSFANCVNISSLSLPNGVTTIEGNAFTGSGISTITIPSTVTSIGSQSGWTPGTIYGEANSQAETYAKDNGITFIVTGENGGSDDDPEEPENPEDPSNPDNPSDPSNPSNPASPGSGTGGSSTGQGAQGTAGGAHVKDATPTTADGIDPRYFLCLAVFAGGVGVILYSRFNKLKYVSDNYKNR